MLFNIVLEHAVEKLQMREGRVPFDNKMKILVSADSIFLMGELAAEPCYKFKIFEKAEGSIGFIVTEEKSKYMVPDRQ